MMTAEQLVYKYAAEKRRVGPQLFMLFLAILISYQSYYIHTGLVPAVSLRISRLIYPYVVYTATYISLIIPASVLATKWSAKYMLCISMTGIGLLHAVLSAFNLGDITTEKPRSQLGMYFLMTVNLMFGAFEAPIMPCVYTLMARMISPWHRAAVGSFILSARHFVVLSALFTAFFASFNVVGTIYTRTHLILTIVALTWGLVFHFLGSDCDLVFVNQGPGFKPRIPWSSILGSLPVWAVIACHATIRDVPSIALLNYPYRLVEAVEALKYAGTFVILVLGGIVAGCLSDKLVEGKYLTRLYARKIFNFLGTSMAMMALAALNTVERAKNSLQYSWLIAILWLVMVGLTCFRSSGFMINHMDLSPYYAGVLVAITIAASQLVKGSILLISIYYCNFNEQVILFMDYMSCIVTFVAGFFFTICAKAGIQDKWSPVPLWYRGSSQSDV